MTWNRLADYFHFIQPADERLLPGEPRSVGEQRTSEWISQ